jgi:regulator of protease activity HflC (stomatin/prohibitin superfamily)
LLDRLIDFLLEGLNLLRFWIVLNPYEAGVQIRLGKFKKVLEPGFHWLLPFGIDQTLHEHTVPRTHTLGDQSVTTLDGKGIGFQAVITYQVNDIKKALMDVEDSDHAIQDSCAGNIAHVLAGYTWADINGKFDEVMDAVTKTCRARGWKFGLEIKSVQCATITTVRTYRLLNK